LFPNTAIGSQRSAISQIKTATAIHGTPGQVSPADSRSAPHRFHGTPESATRPQERLKMDYTLLAYSANLRQNSPFLASSRFLFFRLLPLI